MSRVERTILWVAFCALAALSVYGFYSGKLFAQHVWEPSGLRRFLWFAALYAAWFLVATPRRARWFVPLTAVLVLLYTALAAGVPALLTVLFFLFSALALGKLLWPELEDLLALLLGTGIYILLVSFAVRFPVNYPGVYLAAFAVPVAGNGRRAWDLLRRSLRLVRPRPWEGRAAHALFGLALFVLLAHWLVALKPETSGDGLAMHLTVPASVAFERRWTFDVGRVIWAVMPMGADWGFTAVYLPGGESAARLLNLAMLLVLAGLLFSTVRRWLPAAPAWLAVAMLVSSPVVQLVTGSLLVENTWAAVLFGAALSVARFRESGDRRYVYLAAALAGTALSVKLGALAFVVPLAFFAGFALLRRKGPGLARTVTLALACFVLFAASPYVTAYVKTGNPVFPFLNATFRSPYFESAVSFRDGRFHNPPGWRTPYQLTFETGKYMEGQNGAWGFHYLLLLPLTLLVMRGRKWPYLGWVALVVGLLFTWITFRVQANLRYIYPALPLFMVQIALGLAALRSGLPALYRTVSAAAVLAVGLNLYFLPASGWYQKDFCLNPFDRGDRDRCLANSAPVRPLIDYMNRKHPGAPVVFIETNQVAGLQARAYTNTWHTDAFARKVRFAASAEHCLALMADLGMRYFIAPTRDSGIPIPQTSLRDFLSTDTAVEYRVGRFYLAHLKDEAATMSRLDRGLLPSPPGRYDDFSTRVRFSGSWDRSRQFARTADHTVTYSNAPGAGFRFLFRGKRITWVYTRATNRGMASVVIDGQPRGVVDLYAPAPVWQASTSFDAAGSGGHEIAVSVLGRKSPPATECFVDLDELVVE